MQNYIGCDRNPNTFARYHKIIEFYDKLTGGKKTVQMYNCGAEEIANEIEMLIVHLRHHLISQLRDITKVVKKKSCNRGSNSMNMNLGEIIFIYQYHKKTFDS